MHVVTITGRRIKKINSIMFNDKYYSKRDDCVKLGGKYYPLDHPDIALDLETNEYNLKHRMFHGIVRFEKDEAEYGHFTPSDENVGCYVSRSKKTVAFRQSVIPKHWIENLATGEFYNPIDLSKADIANLTTIRTLAAHTEKGYNIEDNEREYAARITSYEASKPIITKRVKKLARLLGGITFGIENEIVVGTIPESVQRPRGLVLCRDGSVDAGELVSVPMSGAKGVNNIKLIGEEMSRRTISDLTCAYHIHIGNIETSKINQLSLYKLGELIQDELFTMLPYYKTFWRGFKRKNYNKKLDEIFPVYSPNYRIANFKDYISYNYAKLYRYLSSSDILPCKRWNRNPKTLESRVHPRGSKWSIESRYHWINFVNANFSKRNTVEFRCHQNTTNPYKMVNWLFMCNAIVKYAERNARKILTEDTPISLAEVMDIYRVSNPYNKDAAFVSDYLTAYIEDRKAYFDDLIEREDFRGLRDTKEDKEFVFLYEGKALI